MAYTRCENMIHGSEIVHPLPAFVAQAYVILKVFRDWTTWSCGIYCSLNNIVSNWPCCISLHNNHNTPTSLNKCQPAFGVTTARWREAQTRNYHVISSYRTQGENCWNYHLGEWWWSLRYTLEALMEIANYWEYAECIKQSLHGLLLNYVLNA